jgi:hypothetical protein
MNERTCRAGLASSGTNLSLYYIEIFIFARGLHCRLAGKHAFETVLVLPIGGLKRSAQALYTVDSER